MASSEVRSSEIRMPEQLRGIGQQLRTARETAGMSLSDVSTRLKMPTHVIDALEQEQWSKLGAPVYIRGQLRSYARLMGLPEDSIQVAATTVVAPANLVPRTYTSPVQRIAEQTRMRLVYVVLTAAIVVPTWLATQSHLDSDKTQTTVALDVEPAAQQVQSAEQSLTQPSETGTVADPTSGANTNTTAQSQPQPLVASMTPMPQQSVTAADLVIDFGDESWVKLTGPDGHVIEQALIPSGQQRSFTVGQLGKAVLGNAAAVRVSYRGQPVDMVPFVRANVVRFTVSSDGTLMPAGR